MNEYIHKCILVSYRQEAFLCFVVFNKFFVKDGILFFTFSGVS